MNKFEKALLPFLDNGIDGREWMTYVNTHEDTYVTTNAYYLAVCDTKLCPNIQNTEHVNEDIKPNEGFYKAMNGFKTLDNNVKLTIPIAEIESLINKHKPKPIQLPICPECEGSGEVKYSYTCKNGTTYKEEYDCPVCDGNGEQYSDKYNPNPVVFQFNKTFIRLSLFIPIIEAAKLLKEKEISLTHNAKPSTATKWKLGAMTLLLMPTIFDDYTIAKKYTL